MFLVEHFELACKSDNTPTSQNKLTAPKYRRAKHRVSLMLAKLFLDDALTTYVSTL